MSEKRDQQDRDQPDKGKVGHHPRSRHHARYDFPGLIAALPALAPFVSPNHHGDPSIDFADPEAVRELNRALLFFHYGISWWELPPDALCPPVPGRADHIHSVADLLKDEAGEVMRGESVAVLDIGVGASCIYPILGRHCYGWRFVGTDSDPTALESARAIVAANPALESSVELRLAPSPEAIFDGVIRAGETFDVTMCNPPFHGSQEEAAAANQRKRRGLASKTNNPISTKGRNFGGRSVELWCEGGERGFIRRMIEQSADARDRCRWFSTLVSKKGNLENTQRALARVGAKGARTLPIRQGHKASRIVAWTFE